MTHTGKLPCWWQVPGHVWRVWTPFTQKMLLLLEVQHWPTASVHEAPTNEQGSVCRANCDVGIADTKLRKPAMWMMMNERILMYIKRSVISMPQDPVTQNLENTGKDLNLYCDPFQPSLAGLWAWAMWNTLVIPDTSLKHGTFDSRIPDKPYHPLVMLLTDDFDIPLSDCPHLGNTVQCEPPPSLGADAAMKHFQEKFCVRRIISNGRGWYVLY